MKKTLFALALGSLAIATTANAQFYVQGDVGYSKLNFSTNTGSVKKSSFAPQFSVGYDFNGHRLALDYSRYGSFKNNYVAVDTDGSRSVVSEKLSAHGIGLAAFYDIDVNSAFKPYVGVRLANNYISAKVDAKSLNESFSESQKKVVFGYGLLAGANYKVADNVSVHGGVEYNHVGSVENVKVKQYGAKVGLRYDF